MKNDDVIINGIYRHYKGNMYKVIGIANHSETLEKMVVYKAMYADGDLWVRPLDMFTECVEINGRAVARFELVNISKESQ